MRAVILVGHGSLRDASGSAMIRLAARAQAAGVAPVVKAGFLNYSRPAFRETLARVVERGAQKVVVAPYFLVPGKFVRVDLPRLVAESQAAYPTLAMQLAEPFGDHPALARIVLARAAAAADSERRTPGQRALLLMAHGSPNEMANAPLRALAARLGASKHYDSVMLSFMELNEPAIPAALAQLVQQGAHDIVAVPLFLQLGGHVAEDLPAIIAAARMRFPDQQITLASYLGYDPLLVEVIADRVREALR
jgi:sirohydrochlorin cobaltochelatase